MASVSSGSFNTSAYTLSTGNRYLTFNWKVISQSNISNETVISWELVGGGTYQYNPVVSDVHVEINGEVVYDTKSSDHVNVYPGTVVASGTKTIVHNANGSRSFTAYAEAGIFVHDANCSGSGTWELPVINRASVLSVTDGTIGTAQNLKVSRYNTDFKHIITYECGSATGPVCDKTASETISFTPPWDLASQNKVGPTVSVKFILQTYYGDTPIGDPVTKIVTMNIPDIDRYKPSVALAVSDYNGHATTYNAYVKTLSRLKVVATPTLAYGSEISSYNITANGTIYNEASFETDVLKSSGTLSVKATVTDKRGRTSNETTANITVLDYTAPAISKISAIRCNSDGYPNEQGTHLKVTFSASVTSLNSKNTATYTLKYRKTNVSTWTYAPSSAMPSSYTVTDHSYTFAAESVPYVIEVTAADRHNSLTRSADGPASFYLIAPHASGRGLGLGMTPVHEDGLDIGFPIYLGGTFLFTKDSFAPAGHVSGEYDLRDFNSLDDLLNIIYSSMPGRSVKFVRIADNAGTVWGGGGYIVQINKEDAAYGVVEFINYNYQGSALRKCLYGGVWQTLEWENPPAVPGVEYRTTERWNGKPVYTMLLTPGNIASTMVITPPGYAQMRIFDIRGEATLSDGNTLMIPGRYASYEAYFEESYGYSSQPRLRVTDGHVIIGRPLTVRLKYWKTTD